VALTVQIAGEVALISAENPDIAHRPEVTTTKRVTECRIAVPFP
jgi:hypothetical protein